MRIRLSLTLAIGIVLGIVVAISSGTANHMALASPADTVPTGYSDLGQLQEDVRVIGKRVDTIDMRTDRIERILVKMADEK